MSDSDLPIKASLEESETLLRLTLARPKANIVDTEMVGAIRSAVADGCGNPAVRTILFEGEGKHFSFGASVSEHTPAEVGRMLPTFHAMFLELAASNRVCVAAVNGMCLGGGLELALFCHRIYASAGAQFGNPEIKLSVFAPMSSLLLPYRCGQGAVDDLLLTGRNVAAEEAVRLGVVDRLAEDPAAAAVEWHREHIMPLSAAALRHANRAARLRLHDDLANVLPRLEKMYLEELMATKDAVEGITAFLEKRRPSWTNG